MASVTFLEPGGDATHDQSFWPLGYNSTSPGNEGSDGNGSITNDATQSHTGTYSLKSTLTAMSAAYVVTPDGVCADAGTALSFWTRFSTVTPSVNTCFLVIEQASDGTTVLALGITTAGTLRLGGTGNAGGFSVTGTTVLSATTWTRIAVSYVITSGTSFTVKVYLNGVLELTMSNTTGSLNTVTTSCAAFGINDAQAFPSDALMTVWFDDVYIDNRSDLSDPGNISITAKRPYANGTTNGFSTTGTASGYGSGHASYVNGNYPVGSDTTTYVSVVVVASAITEEYVIEGLTVGDVNVTGATIAGVRGWVFASSTLTETDKILVDGTQSSIAVTSTASLFSQNSATPTVYPAGTGTDIGFVTNSTAATAKLFGAGVLIAFIPGAIATLDTYQPSIPGTDSIRQTAQRLAVGRAGLAQSLLFNPPYDLSGPLATQIDTYQPPIPGLDSTRQRAQQQAAIRSRLAQSLGFGLPYDLSAAPPVQVAPYVPPVELGSFYTNTQRSYAQNVVRQASFLCFVPVDAPSVPGQPTDPAIAPIAGDRSYWESQQNLWNRAQYATFQQFGGPSDVAIAPTAIQPVQWDTLYLTAVLGYAARARIATWQLFGVPDDLSTALTQPDTSIQPIPGERSVNAAALAWLKRSGMASAQLWQVPGDPGPLPGQPDTWIQPIPGTGALVLAQTQQKTRSALAATYGWTLPQNTSVATAQPDTYQPPIPGIGVFGQGTAILRTRSSLASRYVWNPPEDLSIAPAQPDTYQPPMAGDGVYLASQRTQQLRARAASVFTWIAPSDRSTQTVQPDTYQPPVPGLGILAGRTRVDTQRRLTATQFLFNAPADLSSGPGPIESSFMARMDGWAEQGGQQLSASGVPIIVPQVQGSFPGCTVTVYLAGTLTLATIFADTANPPTPKANPFTADASGYWFFYGPVLSQHYDIRFSGTGISTPFTIGDQVEPQSALVYNVFDFQATGNGITDDTNAIQSAINAASAAGGGEVWLPAGTYLISFPLTIGTNGVSLVGINRAATTISVASLTAHAVVVTAQNLSVRDLTLSSPTPLRTGDGIHLTAGAFQVVVERVNVKNHYNGIYNGGSANIFRQCISGPNGNHGFYLDGTSAAQNEIDVDFCQSNGNGACGFYLVGPALGVHFNYIVAAGNTAYGLSINAAADIYVNCPEISTNGIGVYCVGVNAITFTGGLYESSTTGANISLLDSNNLSFSGGFNQTTVSTTNGFGLVIYNCAYLTVGNMNIFNCAAGGIQYVGNNADVTLTGVICPAAGDYGPIAITSNAAGNPTVITTSLPLDFNPVGWVSIFDVVGGSPSINGGYIGTVLTPTTLSIPVTVTVGGTGGYITNGQPVGIVWNTGCTGPISIVGGAYSGIFGPTSGTIPAGSRVVGALGMADLDAPPYFADAYSTNAATGSTVLTAASISGGSSEVTLNMTSLTGSGTLTLPTVAALLAALINPVPGQTYKLRIINSNSGTWTVAASVGWTLVGTMSIIANSYRDFYVTINTVANPGAMLQSIGIGGYT
jgi:Pectate lyase superfamily protein